MCAGSLLVFVLVGRVWITEVRCHGPIDVRG